jgi:hypothetical protein
VTQDHRATTRAGNAPNRNASANNSYDRRRSP